jgi:hypothetical protein
VQPVARIGSALSASVCFCGRRSRDRIGATEDNMPPMNLPSDINAEKLAEVSLAILSLTLHGDGRVWKSLDWDLMDLLHDKGWIVESRTKAKSVVLTDEGERLAKEFMLRHFGQRA